MVQDQNAVGVVIGRFHVPSPHAGHQAVIRYVQGLHKDVLVVLGESAGYATDTNPLPLELRRMMMKREFPGVKIASLKDMRDDAMWSEMLDELITETYPGRAICLYGSRDSFIRSYTGSFETTLVPEVDRKSGTSIRERVGRKPSIVAAFRRGVIWAILNRAPIVYQTVDLAILDRYNKRVLLGRKRFDPPGKFRFIGGFVDPTDQSYECAMRREKAEETGLFEIGKLEYIGSSRIDDWRYRGTKDGVMTTFFSAPYIFGAPEPADDIEQLRWFDFDQYESVLVPEHEPLGEMLAKLLVAEGHLACRELNPVN